MFHFLSRVQQDRLRQASGKGKDFNNPLLERVIQSIQQQTPEAFHTKKTLVHRIFFHEPVTMIPYARFIHPFLKPKK